MLDQLRSKWRQALGTARGGHEWRATALPVRAAVSLLAGVRERDERICLILEAPLSAAPRQKAKLEAQGISLVDVRDSDEGLMRIAVTLERADLLGVFEVLAADLVAVITGGKSASESIGYFLRRIDAWQACLRVRARGMSAEEQLGLFGELLVFDLVATHLGFPGAIAAWEGPAGGIHDFSAGGMAIEVKATLGVGHHIRISSLDQLSTVGLAGLALTRVKLSEDPAGNTLPEAISLVHARIASDCPLEAEMFNESLLRVGYLDIDADLYASPRMTLYEIAAYRVLPDFPRLTGRNVAGAIVDANYTLDERHIGGWMMRPDEWAAFLLELDGGNDRRGS